MMMGTWCLTQVSMSRISRSLLRWQIWLTAKGAAGRSGWAASWVASSALSWVSHSSSSSAGRALSAGKEPTMPALHSAATRRGFETMNIGEAMTGRLSRDCTLSSQDMDGLLRVPRLRG
jgi:hypothetical protein